MQIIITIVISAKEKERRHQSVQQELYHLIRGNNDLLQEMAPEKGIEVSQRKSRRKKMETYHIHGLEDSTVFRNLILSKLVYRLNAVPTQILRDFCVCFCKH